jgi:NhaP-type Na+/H+ or K+/H+ antiporter
MLKKKVMKITSNQWIEIVKLIATFVIGVITTLFVHSCTVSLSVAKNNTNSSQKTEQTSTSSVDSTHININTKH